MEAPDLGTLELLEDGITTDEPRGAILEWVGYWGLQRRVTLVVLVNVESGGTGFYARVGPSGFLGRCGTFLGWRPLLLGGARLELALCSIPW